MDTNEMCKCGHKKAKHRESSIDTLPCLECNCFNFRPAPSQPSRTGFELDNGTSGTVANTHYLPEVRDEKIARIVKEFREKFVRQPAEIAGVKRVEWRQLATDKVEEAEAWLSQTLTTLLNEE